VYIAGADLSHVGPRFGDPPLDARTKEEIEAIDREALAAAEKGDADGWFTSIATHQDSSRICGYAPVYATLRCAAPGPGRRADDAGPAANRPGIARAGAPGSPSSSPSSSPA